MADHNGTGNDSATAVLEPAAVKPAAAEIASAAKDAEQTKKKRGKEKPKKDEKDALEYEVEFETPFGKIEFEFEPIDRKKKKDEERREKAEKAALKLAEKQAKLAEKRAKRGDGRRRGGILVPLLIFALIAGAIIAAYWLFARPGEDEVPPEYLTDPDMQPQPQGFVEKARARVSSAVRAGRQASREAQREQEQRFEDLTSGR